LLLGQGPVADESTSVPEFNLADALQRSIGARLDRRFSGVHTRIYLVGGLLIAALAAAGALLWLQMLELQAEVADLRAGLARAGNAPPREQTSDQSARLARLEEKLDAGSAETLRAIRALPDQSARLNQLGEKLDKNAAEAARTLRASADQATRLDGLGEKLDKTLADTTRALQDSTRRMESTLSATAPAPAPAAAAPTATASAPPFAAMALSAQERETIRAFFGVRRKSDAVAYEAKLGDLAPEAAPLYPVPSLLYDNVRQLKAHRFFADEAEGTIVLIRPEDNRVVAII
jgi:hypothetical protein